MLSVVALLGAAVVPTAHAAAQTEPPRDAISWQSAGDSYSSGTGIDDAAGACWHSPGAYGPRAASMVKDSGWRISSETFTACHGHFVEDFFNRRAGSGAPSLWEWSRQQGGPGRVDVLTMSFGGNDIGFEDLMADCVQLPTTYKKAVGGITGLLSGGLVGAAATTSALSCSWSKDDVTARIDALLDPPRRNCAGTRVGRTDLYGCDLDIGSRRGSIIDFYYDIVQNQLTEHGHLYIIGLPPTVRAHQRMGRPHLCGNIQR